MSSFYTCVSKITIIQCMLPEIWSVTDIIFIILGHFLPFYPLNIPKNQNLQKKKQKNNQRYHHFTQAYTQ